MPLSDLGMVCSDIEMDSHSTNTDMYSTPKLPVVCHLHLAVVTPCSHVTSSWYES